MFASVAAWISSGVSPRKTFKVTLSPSTVGVSITRTPTSGYSRPQLASHITLPACALGPGPGEPHHLARIATGFERREKVGGVVACLLQVGAAGNRQRSGFVR